MRPSPATPSEAIGPRGDLELYAAHRTTVLEPRVPYSASFLVEGYLSPDVKPLLLDAGIRRRQLSQFRQSLQSFCISALRHKPTGSAKARCQRLL